MASVRQLVWFSFVALVGMGPVRPAPVWAEPGDERLAVAFEDGAQAPAHGWTQDDGCPARTGASAARPLRGELERAWKVTAREGVFEGEPLAWKDRVFVVERAKTRRIVRVLAASSGAERARFAVDGTSPLFPTVGEGRLLLKTSPTTPPEDVADDRRGLERRRRGPHAALEDHRKGGAWRPHDPA